MAPRARHAAVQRGSALDTMNERVGPTSALFMRVLLSLCCVEHTLHTPAPLPILTTVLGSLLSLPISSVDCPLFVFLTRLSHRNSHFFLPAFDARPKNNMVEGQIDLAERANANEREGEKMEWNLSPCLASLISLLLD